MNEVLIVGAGPAGLLLAAELRLAGIGTTVIERDRERPGFCRGFNLNARALDLLARRGLADRLIGEGWKVPHAAFSGLPVTLSLPGTHTDHPYSLGIPQTRVEEILEEHVLGLGADLRRGHELRDLEQDGESVVATVATGSGLYRIEAAYLVGCDGGRSTVRKLAGIDFPGTPATRFSLLGDVELADPASVPFGPVTGPGGAVFVIPRPGYVRMITADQAPPPDKDDPVTLDMFQAAVDAALGRHVELRAARWLTRFGDAARQASDYVRGRIVLAGDAAHIHPPAGAIGVNVALDDAFNLGWKLAATLRGGPAHLLGTYHTERHTAGAHVLANTQAQVLLANAGDRLGPLVDLLTRVAGHPAGNRALAETVTGLDTRYAMRPESGHPWLGRLAPNLTLTSDGGATNLAIDLATLLSAGRWLLLDLTGSNAIGPSATGWTGIDVVHATCPGHPDLHGILLRPDGHTAWLSTGGHESLHGSLRESLHEGLHEALEHWFGVTRA
ncbi:FAD-dependent monooxygenase [Streptosporangiaceae bacterium NEAU-GS5]|nr:FAD-dependent monooxygenase [Streptosporangiaceae bacterium NEAU-GS5]